jgi:predicted transposase YbfD/YdcC
MRGVQTHPNSTEVTKPQLISLITILEEVPDPRVKATVDHDLVDILTIALCTLLCGGDSFYDMEEFGEVRLDWLKTFLRLRNGAPTHDTYNRVFQALDPERFGDSLARWTQSVRRVLGGEVVALDGKTVRRALNRGEDARVIVSAWATESGLLLGQRKVRDKSNEITAVPELLRALELAGCIVTADALHCQKGIAREILEADAQYVLALKGNQGTTFGEVKAFLDEAIERDESHLVFTETVEKGHGRLEVRRYWQTEKLGWFADREAWEGLRSVGVVEARRRVGDKESVERRYYLSSLPAEVQSFARAVRGHWGVENSLHWVLDVVFGEDQSRARSGYAAENLAATRRLAVNLLRRDKSCKRSVKGKLMRAAIDPDYLRKVLTT